MTREELDKLSNHALFNIFQSSVMHYESCLIRHEGNIDKAVIEMEETKDVLLSRMNTPDTIRLKIH